MKDRFPLVFGVLVTTVLSGTLVIAGLKAGITPGVSPLVILLAWGAFTRASTGNTGSRFLNIAQVAGSAGMAVTAGVIFTAPLVQILYADKGLEVPPVDVKTLIYVSLAGALIGYGFVGLATKKFLTDPTLPAPEARACEAMIEAAVSHPDAKPRLAPSLYLGLLLSFLAPLLGLIGVAKDHLELYAKKVGSRNFGVDLPFNPMYLGIGGLLTIATALLVFAGSFLRLIGDGLLASIDPNDAAGLAAFPDNSMRWVGGGAMTVAVAYSLVRFLRVHKVEGGEALDPLLEIDPKVRRGLILSVVVGVGMLLGWLLWREGGPTPFALTMSLAVLVMCFLMVTLGAILSLQIGSSASPVSGTIFVTTLVLCLVALAFGHHEPSDVLMLTPLLVGACVAVCAANDSSQDYKTMQLCKVRVQDGFFAQLMGLIAGSIVVPIVLYVADQAYTLGSPELSAPQGKMFATLIDGLLLQDALPWKPIYVGLAIGAVAVALDIVAGKRGIPLPAMALAVGIYLPPSLGVGILIGAGFRWFAERGTGKQRNESILAAAGLITGAAAFELLQGILILFGADMDRFVIFGDGEGQRMLPAYVTQGMTLIGILILGVHLFYNSRPGSYARKSN
ncbi:MAG: OPT/YSL family transporter [Planctomycetes bacterium]|nr:OPT/YSL family transporter [Planctomycetota bacterium]MCB9911283.1 OPT/YSL family transporter [Planctomycetota bacterium]MCB9911546.1 OPT/YSL family transporter [Planctomycetota bacterium]